MNVNAFKELGSYPGGRDAKGILLIGAWIVVPGEVKDA